MSQFPTLPQPEPENRCPGCLYIKLLGTPVLLEQPIQPLVITFDSQAQQNEIEQIDLHLSIKFNEQWLPLMGGRIKFGIKSGELKLKLENGELPYESRQLIGSIELILPEEKPKPEKSNEQQRQEVSWSNLLPSLNGSKAGVRGFGTPTRRTEKLGATTCQITTTAFEENPTWIFEEDMGEPVLKGKIENIKLATLNVKVPTRVEATFEVSKRDVHLTDAQGLWPPDISRNKRAVLERLIVLRVLEPKLKPYLSRQELHYG
ncbi:hypothetical protein [Funiculus sociatus]|uniref:hypothetical protein n=1 Tax=Funiculus sociatus TaxID=450527 RepID=UPI003297D0D8